MPDPVSGCSVVALAGASGFIGRHVQSALLDAGYTVRALIRKETVFAAQRDVEVACVDLASERSLSNAVAGCCRVVYCAGTVRGRSLEDFRPANVEGVDRLTAALARRHRVPLLLMSSLAASAPHLSPYAESKAQGERILQNSGLDQWTIFRPPAVYGPGDKEMRATFDMIRKGLVPVLGPRQQRIPFIEVSDLGRAAVAWAEHPRECAGHIYAIDDGAPGGYSWSDIQAALAPARSLSIRVPHALLAAIGQVNLALSRIAGYAPMLTPGKVRELTHLEWACSNTEFTDATGWSPTVGLAQGVSRLAAQ